MILSLVRTKSLGVMGEPNRFANALSRARLGLYVFGCKALLETEEDLKEITSRLCSNGDRLQLVTGEMYPTRRLGTHTVEPVIMEGVEHLGQYVFEMSRKMFEHIKRQKEGSN